LQVLISIFRLNKRKSSSQGMQHGLEKVTRLIKALSVHGANQLPSQAWLILRGLKGTASFRCIDGNNSQPENTRGTVLYL